MEHSDRRSLLERLEAHRQAGYLSLHMPGHKENAALAPYLEEDAALYPYEQVNISGQSRTVTQLLYLNTPGNVDYISNNTVQVVVTIVPEEFVNVATGANQNAGQNP